MKKNLLCILRLKEREIDLTKKTCIMGIINVTPDSFSDGGDFLEPRKAVDHAFQLIDEGADIIDIGGESSRPGALPVSLDDELKRVIPVITEIRKKTDIPVSIDTYKSEVAQKALLAGADIVNDISGLTFDPDMAPVIAEHQAACVIMHIKGTPQNMQLNPYYDDVVAEITTFFEKQIEYAAKAGIMDKKIILDPGIGFGKRFEDNIEIHRKLNHFTRLHLPILFGSSRKSFLGKILDLPVDERLEGTIASNVIAALNGANIIRVHDVAPLAKAMKVVDAIKIDRQFVC